MLYVCVCALNQCTRLSSGIIQSSFKSSHLNGGSTTDLMPPNRSKQKTSETCLDHDIHRTHQMDLDLTYLNPTSPAVQSRFWLHVPQVCAPLSYDAADPWLSNALERCLAKRKRPPWTERFWGKPSWCSASCGPWQMFHLHFIIFRLCLNMFSYLT